MSMCGGIGPIKDADTEIFEIFNDEVKADLRQKLSKDVSVLTPVKYGSQVVAGTNFFVKVDIGNDEYVHVRIFRPLPHTGEPPNVVSVQENKSLTEEVAYF